MNPDDSTHAGTPPARQGDERAAQAARPAQGLADPPREDELDELDELDEELNEQLAHLTVEVAPAGLHAATFIEADEQHRFYNDTDSTLGDDVISDTTSLKSSAVKYVQENGRRYHAPRQDVYFLPNDDDELERLDIFHQCLVRRAHNKLHLAPIPPDTQRILDVGTGTGIWAIEMGDLYPSAYIVGNDISPVQPDVVPPNVFFEVDDIENDWVFSAPFNYIHIRYLTGSIKDWPRLMRQSFNNLTPGGWIECADLDLIFYTNGGQYTEDCAASKWSRQLSQGVLKLGMDPYPCQKLEGWMRDAGFINIKYELFPVPLGPWPKDKVMKEIGTYDLIQFLQGLDGFSLRIFCQLYNWSIDEVKVFHAAVRKDFLNFKLQIQHDYVVVYGQKPR